MGAEHSYTLCAANNLANDLAAVMVIVEEAGGTWTDRLGESFSDLDLSLFPDVGHFPHREDPDRASDEIAAFFKRIGWG